MSNDQDGSRVRRVARRAARRVERACCPPGTRRDLLLSTIRYGARRLVERPAILLDLPSMLAARLRRLTAAQGVASAPTLPAVDARRAPGACTLVRGRVSVVVPVLHEGEDASPALASLATQGCPDLEIIVVGPRGAVAAALGRTPPHLSRTVHVLEHAAGDGWNGTLDAAARVCTGEFWMYVSAGSVLEPNEVRRMLAVLDGNTAADVAIGCDGPGASGLLRGSRGLTCVATGWSIAEAYHHPTLSADAGGQADVQLTVAGDAGARRHLARLFPGAVFPDRQAAGAVDVLSVTAEDPAAAPRVGETTRHDRVTIAVAIVAPHDAWPGWVARVCRVFSRDAVAAVVSTERAAAVAELLGVALVTDDSGPPASRALDTFARAWRLRKRSTPGASPRGSLAGEDAHEPDARHELAPAPQPTAPPGARPASRRLKVLLQATDFTHGGLEHVVLGLGDALRSHGAEVTLLVTGRVGAAVADARARGWPVVIDPRAEEAAHYERLLDRLAPDLVHAHDAWWGAASCRARGVPFVQTLQNCHVWLTTRERDRAARADEATTAYACVSEQVARHAALGLGLDVGKMVLVPNGIDAAPIVAAGQGMQRARARQALGIPPGALVFLCVASVLPAKNQRALVKAFARVRAAEPAARLVLLGGVINHAYWADVARAIEVSGAGDSVLHRPFTGDVAAYYSAADVAVLPSLWEGWSLALAEAIVAGLAVVATRVGSAAAFEALESVFLLDAPAGPVEELDSGAVRRFSWRDDPGFVAQLAEAMREAAAVAPRRREVSPALPSILSRDRTHDAYLQLHLWLASGGSVKAARRLVADCSAFA